ncbi:nitrate- and nitrite sensing domain-containing protein [Streptomyces sp. PR69]|uniref:sensor histidine kinase n=1 Tax=Streptomyces sp. PR69 TaxID=2984950 RepID=UPI00226548BE|nr:nitrate- and nitrite sensing domain-containing protein [Streptomyces sp. PR69]
MRLRGKSIRRKIVTLLLIPLVSLTALWGFATVLTGREAGRLLDVSSVAREVGRPVEDAVHVIQEERRQTLVYLADPRAADALPVLHRQREATDRAVAAVRQNAGRSGVRDAMSPQSARKLDSLLDALDGLGALRRSVEAGEISRRQALEFYNRVVDPCHGFLTTLHALDDVALERQGRALVSLMRARETLSREDALIASALTTRKITGPEIRALTDLVAQRTLHYDAGYENLPARDREIHQQIWRSPRTSALRDAEERLIAQGPAAGLGAAAAERWQQAARPVLDDLAREAAEAGDRYRDRVEPAAREVFIKAGIAGVLGFLALLLSVIVSVRVGRDLVRSLTRLRKEAHEVSGVRLPSVMRRLAAGEQVDVETEAPRLEYDKDEIGQAGQALNTLQRAAVEAAVRQAELRRGVSEVFVNLARRNQVLLHRQLALLDAMERRTEDAGELADLFRLDHLTTRMRRHAEGLVILSGAAPSRQWRKPIQLMDVVRAAVAEVEDYERIEVRRLLRLGVVGPAVADLTHLIAELLENATVFSPPHTAVHVHGEQVANGFTLEIHDRGLGMTADALLDANLRLAETPEFELSDTDRLGLFVVSRLAQRQGVRVSLQPSPYGGTTAVVFIPAALLTEAPETRGAGFRLDRKSESPAGRRGRDGRQRGDGTFSVLPAQQSALLDGPVELEPPVGPVETSNFDPPPFNAAVSLPGDVDDLSGGEGSWDGPRGRRHPLSDDRRQQPSQPPPRQRRGGPAPLPRRKPPTLVPVPDPPDPPPPSAPSPEGGAPLLSGPSDGLPRRVRQASRLLREADPETVRLGTRQETGRDPEEVRDRMAAMQRGWRRGRSEGGPDGTGDDTRNRDNTRNRNDTGTTRNARTTRTTTEGDGR